MKKNNKSNDTSLLFKYDETVIFSKPEYYEDAEDTKAYRRIGRMLLVAAACIVMWGSFCLLLSSL